MPTTIKFMIFSLIGSVVFLLVALFFPFLIFVSTGFWIMACLSLVVFIFNVLQTRHHFLKSSIGFAIGTVFLCVIQIICEGSGINTHTDIFFVLVNNLFCLYGTKICFIVTICNLTFLILDYMFTWLFSLSKERNVIPFTLFRVSVYVTYALLFISMFLDLMIPMVNVILQILMFFAVLFDVIALMILLSSQIKASLRAKLLICNLYALLLSVVLYYHIRLTGDYFKEFIHLGQINITFLLQIFCNVLVFLLILQSFIYMLICILKPKTSILHCFSPVMYAAIGLLLSGSCYYKGSLASFYLSQTGIVHYISMISFAIGIAVSFMSAAYKLIFTNTETKKTGRINIDED